MSKKTQKPYFQDAVSEILADVGDLLIRKQIDYGPHALKRFGLQGIIVRLNDKMERLINLTQFQATPEVDESIEDTLADMIGYATLGLIMQKYGFPLPLKQKDPTNTP